MVTKMLRAAAQRNNRLTRRLPSRTDDSGSLMFALLLVFVATALAGIMSPVLLTAISGTRTTQQRTTSLVAAEAGIDVVMAQIRQANDGTISSDGTTPGVLGTLPCTGPVTSPTPITGSVTTGLNPRYSVTVSYYKVDPRGYTDGSTASNNWLSANSIQCVIGGGLRSAPAYALITSQGSDQASGALTTGNSRTVNATYIFTSNNANIAGGLIHVFKLSNSKDLCIDAGSGSPAAGTLATMQLCTIGSPKQLFSYNRNLTITLVASINSALPLGMCLDAGAAESNGAQVAFQPCGQTTKIQQQWSLNNAANFQGTNNGSDANGPCFDVQNQNTIGSLIVLGDCGNGTNGQLYDNIKNWAPDAAVGAGAAGASSGQLVNFNQFGRCLDVTENNITYGYLIDWPCKQAPDPANVSWNQHWQLPTIASGATSGTGIITTNYSNNGTLYCLKSPGSTAAGQYVNPTTTGCPQNGARTGSANLTWTVYGKTSDYATSF